MNLFLQTHIVKKGESLKDIIAIYNIPEVEMLRSFHNQNAPKDNNHLGGDIFTGQEIFIPSKENIKIMLFERREKKVFQNDSLKNTFITPNLHAINQSYRVRIKYFLANNPENAELLEFDTHIKYLGKSEDKLSVLQYRKDNYLINKEMPDFKLYELAVLGTDFLYPLELCLQPETFKPHIITNIKDVKSRWNEKREQLQKTYKDLYTSRYIQAMDEAINEGFSQYFMNDLFIQFLFAPYAEFVNGKSGKERYFNTYRMAYLDTMKIEVLDEIININQTAYCIDPRTAQQILAKYKPTNDLQGENNDLVESDISGTYQLNRYDKILQKARVKISTAFYDEEEIIEIEIDSVS